MHGYRTLAAVGIFDMVEKDCRVIIICMVLSHIEIEIQVCLWGISKKIVFS